MYLLPVGGEEMQNLWHLYLYIYIALTPSGGIQSTEVSYLFQSFGNLPFAFCCLDTPPPTFRITVSSCYIRYVARIGATDGQHERMITSVGPGERETLQCSHSWLNYDNEDGYEG